MNFRTGYSLFASTTLCLTLSLAGCKSNPPANQTSSTSQPAASQPATPDSMSPATPAQQPAASTQQPATSGQPSPSDQSAAPAAAPGAAAPQPAAPAPPPPPVVVVLPAGTSIRVRLDSDLGSKISQPGDSFTATVADDVLKGGDVIIARGARARGAVVDAKPLGKFKGGAVLEIKLDSVRSRWGSYPVETASISRAEQGKGKRSTALIGGGAGFGAIVGALAGGGKGAAIGALAGGGAGTAGSAFTGNKQIVLPAETLLTFKLDHAVHITMTNAQDQPALQTR